MENKATEQGDSQERDPCGYGQPVRRVMVSKIHQKICSTHRYHNGNHGTGRTCSAGTVSEMSHPSPSRAEEERKRTTLVIARLADRHATQMRTHAEHDEPLEHLDSALVRLRITQGLPVHLARLVDLALRAVTYKHGLATPLDDCVLPLGSSISTLASPSTSADADIVPRNSVTDDLATEAESTPMRLMGFSRRSSRALRARRGAAPTCAWCTGGRCLWSGLAVRFFVLFVGRSRRKKKHK